MLYPALANPQQALLAKSLDPEKLLYERGLALVLLWGLHRYWHRHSHLKRRQCVLYKDAIARSTLSGNATKQNICLTRTFTQGWYRIKPPKPGLLVSV